MPISWIDDLIAVGVQADAKEWSGWIVNVAQEFDVAPTHQQGYIKYGGVVSGMPILPLVRDGRPGCVPTESIIESYKREVG